MRALYGLFGFGLVSISLVACGTEAPPPPPPDFGFLQPVNSLKANEELGEDDWAEIGAADLSCLNTPSNDIPTSVPVTLTTQVLDFQSDDEVPGATVHAFRGQDESDEFDLQMSDQTAMITFTIPMGVTRFGYKMICEEPCDPASLDTLLLNQKVDPDTMIQTEGSIRSVSKATAATMPALIGISRTPGTGVLAGAMRDCQDREVSNFVAAVTTSSGVSASGGTHAEVLAYVEESRVGGADTYYFSSSVGLPVRHNQKQAGSEDGLFMVVELEEAPVAFVQVWGYLDDAARDADELTLIAELETASIPDTVITGSYEPLRSE